MRQITKKAREAFRKNKNFSLSNTDVQVKNGITELYLFGNLIAKKVIKTDEVFITNAGWESNTTYERLRGVLDVDLYKKGGKSYLNGKVCGGKMTKIC